jgi:hypothetical protein
LAQTVHYIGCAIDAMSAGKKATTPERDFQAQRGANAVPIWVSVIFARGVAVAWHRRGLLEKPSNARV